MERGILLAVFCLVVSIVIVTCATELTHLWFNDAVQAGAYGSWVSGIGSLAAAGVALSIPYVQRHLDRLREVERKRRAMEVFSFQLGMWLTEIDQRLSIIAKLNFEDYIPHPSDPLRLTIEHDGHIKPLQGIESLLPIIHELDRGGDILQIDWSIKNYERVLNALVTTDQYRERKRYVELIRLNATNLRILVRPMLSLVEAIMQDVINKQPASPLPSPPLPPSNVRFPSQSVFPHHSKHQGP